MAEPTNTPMPTAPPTPRSASPVLIPTTPTSTSISQPGRSLDSKPTVLHIGDPVKYNPETYAEFTMHFEVIRPGPDERLRPAFLAALRDRKWGDFAAIFRPFWGSGGEMGYWDEELVARLPDSMRVFASAGAGFDWADTKALGERGIIYCNAGLAASEAVADFAVALIISTFRALPYCLSSALSGDSKSFAKCHDFATSRSHNLRGRVLGLVGLGNIGQQLAHRCAAGFGMKIAYYDVERKSSAIEGRLGPARFFPTFKTLVSGSDCVVLCAPSGAGRLINAESLAWFKPGARLVNIARGTLVDEEALADALETGHIDAIALDVHADEPNVHPRLKAFAGSKATLTCHNAGGTVETHVGFEELGMRNIMAVLGGAQPITPVNLQWLRRK